MHLIVLRTALAISLVVYPKVHTLGVLLYPMVHPITQSYVRKHLPRHSRSTPPLGILLTISVQTLASITLICLPVVILLMRYSPQKTLVMMGVVIFLGRLREVLNPACLSGVDPRKGISMRASLNGGSLVDSFL